MRKVAQALVIICLSIHAGSLSAACKSEACKQATAWKNGYTAIVLDDNIGRKDYFAVLDVVKANKGVVAIEAERVLLGWLPVNAAGKLRSTRGVSAVLYDPAPRVTDLVHRDEAIAALSYFNRVRTGEFEDTVEAGLAVKGEPLTGCVIPRPTSSALRSQSLQSTSSDSRNREDRASVLKIERTPPDTEDPNVPKFPGVVSPNFWFHTPYHNPSMRGRITVQLFRLDSDGSIDPNLYTWTNTDIGTSRDQVYSAYTFWVDEAAARGITLSFTVKTMDPFSRYTRSLIPTPTHYEPITHSGGDDYLWINDALGPLGYGASPVTQENVYNQNDAFNGAMAADPTYGPYDGSYSVYVVYNPSPAPSQFANGQRAYGMYDGPYTMIMWNSAGWGPNNLGLVLTHETGHIFWACDEYYDAPSNTGCYSCLHCFFNVGPRNQQTTPWITNANCDYPNASSCDVPRTTCVMKDQSHTLCPHTPGQIGW
ncbi:MAG: hypothetical protein QOC81_133 [Thermoanaerobaculia bacterium]|jgi:hypothetical protein|nr:hypothetical protein [Thermoanaerobaculia bacterium]